MTENTLTQTQSLTLLISYVDSLVSNPIRRSLSGIVADHIRKNGDNETSIEALLQSIATELEKMLAERETITGLSGFTIPAQPIWEAGGLVGCSVNAALRRLDGTLEAGTTTRKLVAKMVKEKKESELLPKVAKTENVAMVA